MNFGFTFYPKTKAFLLSANAPVAEALTRAASRDSVAVSMLLLQRHPFSLLTLQLIVIGMNLKALIKDQ